MQIYMLNYIYLHTYIVIKQLKESFVRVKQNQTTVNIPIESRKLSQIIFLIHVVCQTVYKDTSCAQTRIKTNCQI